MKSDLAFPKNWKMSTFSKSIFMLTALKPTPGWKYPKKDLSRQERSPVFWTQEIPAYFTASSKLK